MTKSDFDDVTTAARGYDTAIVSNVAYIRRELPQLQLSDDLRSKAEEVCSTLIDTYHDLVDSLLSDLDELLNVEAPVPLPIDSVRVVLDQMIRCFQAGIDMMHELVTALETAKETEPSCVEAYVLVAESAANILNAYERTAEAMDARELVPGK